MSIIWKPVRQAEKPLEGCRHTDQVTVTQEGLADLSLLSAPLTTADFVHASHSIKGRDGINYLEYQNKRLKKTSSSPPLAGNFL